HYGYSQEMDLCETVICFTIYLGKSLTAMPPKWGIYLSRNLPPYTPASPFHRSVAFQAGVPSGPPPFVGGILPPRRRVIPPRRPSCTHGATPPDEHVHDSVRRCRRHERLVPL